MYEKINLTETMMQTLTLFTFDFKKERYIREVASELKISPQTAQLSLEKLEKKGILKGQTKGKIKLFKLQITPETKQYILFAQQYKTICFLEKKPRIKEITQQITPYIKGIGLIFGSYVKELEHEKSDLDIFVVGKHNNTAIQKIAKTFQIDISIKEYPKHIFEKELGKDTLIKEVLKNHISITNTEEFINSVVKHAELFN